jgi:hypothetical protein
MRNMNLGKEQLFQQRRNKAMTKKVQEALR